jgi:hypothetical protein
VRLAKASWTRKPKILFWSLLSLAEPTEQC